MTETTIETRTPKQRTAHVVAVLFAAGISYVSVNIALLWAEIVWADITHTAPANDLGGIMLKVLALGVVMQLLILVVDVAKLNLKDEFSMWQPKN